ncbi:MAG TPA: DUF4230 domain-containing protein [Cellvibrionaceae bacterium]
MSKIKIFILVTIVISAAFTAGAKLHKFLKFPFSSTNSEFNVESIKSIGRLVVMQAVLKEITTAEIKIDEQGRELGTPKKAAYIITFEVEFSYDLKNGPFGISINKDENTGHGVAVIDMPPVDIIYHMKNIEIYDEQEGRWFGIIQKLSIGEKNQIIQQAKLQAFEQAKNFISKYKLQYENSATQTMQFLAKGFGQSEVLMQFQKSSNESIKN